MPYPNQHAARLISPERFEKGSFRTIALTSGITAIIGRLKGKATTVRQAIRFNKSKYSVEQAKKWLKEHNIRFISFEEASNKITAFVSLQALKIIELSQNEIMSMVPKDALDKLKQKDEHPFLQAFSICHPGTSNPKILGQSKQTPIHWTTKAVQSIKNIMLKGVKAFLRHNDDNSVNGRRAIGRVVGNGEKIINGELHHIVVMYHAPKDVEIAKKMDVCSQEGEWNLIDYGKKYLADTVNKITGIALSMSGIEKPAFSGAVKLGMVQAFNNNNNNSGETGKIKSGEDKMPLNFNEIKQAVRDMNIHAWQLYSLEDIKSDKEFSKIFSDLDETKKENNNLKKENDDYKTEKEKLLKENQQATLQKRFADIIKESKLVDKQRKFLEKKFTKYDGDISDKSLNEFVENGLSEYREYAPLFKIDENKDNYNNGVETSNKDDLTKADSNEFLKDDYLED